MDLKQRTQLLTQTFRMLIDGELAEASDGATMETVNPATGETIAQFPAASNDDVDRAVQAATIAQSAWGALDTLERREHVLALGNVLREHSEEFGAL
ncbi:MAG: aldehyde dehydrogenase family protein, partial [Pseudomonadota bacterium]